MQRFRWLVAVLALASVVGAGHLQTLEAQSNVDRMELKQSSKVTPPAFHTRKGFVACTSRESLVKLIAHIANEETEAHQAMVRDTSSGCFLLKAGVEVEPVAHNEYVVELRPKGMKGTIFTVLEAVEPKKGRT